MAHFNEALAKKNEKNDDKKCFSFDFSLDSMGGSEDEDKDAEAVTATAKKRNRSKAKKKKRKDCAVDATTAVGEAGDKCANDSDPTNRSDIFVSVLCTDPAVEDASKGISTTTDCSNNLDQGTKKKKKKKKKEAKAGKSIASDEDDDIDSLVREINLLTSSEMTNPTPATSTIPISGKIQSTNSINIPNRKNDTSSTFTFKSHKDPELSEEQRALFRFGNGKNLVAIGPPKQKARDSIWRLPPPPGLRIPAEMNTINNQIKSEPQSHCSPFSFGFGL